MKLGDAVLTLRVDDKEFKAGLDRGKKIIGDFTVAITAAIAFSKELLDAFIEDEDALVHLQAAFHATGKEAKSNADLIARLGTELAKTTVFSEGETLAAAAMLEQLSGISEEALERVIPAVQDMASAMGIDLTTAAQQVGKVLDGSTESFGRTGLAIEKNLDPAQRLDATVKLLTEHFGGMAAAMGDTLGGTMKRFFNSFEELASAGGRVLDIFVRPFVALLGPIVDKLVGWVNGTMDLYQAQNALSAGTATSTQMLLLYNDALKQVNKQIADAKKKRDDMNASVAAGREMNKADQQTWWQLSADIDNWTAAAKDLQKKIDATNKKLKETTTQTKALGTEIKKTSDIMIGTTHDMTGMAGVVQVLDTESSELTETVKRLGKEMHGTFGAIKPALDTSVKDAEEWADGWKGAIDLVSSSLKTTFSYLGSALAKGELTWEAFGKTVLGVIGDIVIAIGDQLAADAAVHAVKALVNVFLGNFAGATSEGIAAGLEFAGAAAAWAAGAAIKSSGGFAQGADFTVPPGYPEDSYPMRVQSGEHVSVTPAGEGGQRIQNTIILDGKVLADWATRASRNGRILTRARSVVP